MLHVLALLLVTLLAPSLAQAQLSASPNRPADAVNLADMQFSSWTTGPVNSTTGQTCASLGGQWANGFITSDPTAPKSPSSILREIKDTSTGIGGMAYFCTFPQTSKRVYAVIWMKAPTNFKGLASNQNKIVGMISQNFQHLVLPLLTGFCGTGQVCDNLQLRFSLNALSQVTPGAGNNCHVSGAIAIPGECAGIAMMFAPNVSDYRFTLGGWHRIEWLFDIGSCTFSNLNCRDGIIRAWIDGVLTHNYTNINHHPSEWNEIAWSHTWDGQDAGQPNPAQWDTDHYTIARYGAATPPTIVDNPVGAPRAPSGVTAIVQ